LNGGCHKLNGRICLSLLPRLLAGGLAPSLCAAEIDESKLPPAATIQVDFARDIKPILEVSCVRCHGPEKPKSRFRLDNRAAALKGGENGVDILPGNSAKSPLIHYVARLVTDLEMPPEGKGDPLTSGQVGLLRAWIDQGAPWNDSSPTNLFDLSISPTAGGVFVSGDKHQFRDHYWRRDGFDGGLEGFEVFDQADPDTKVSVTGHVLRDDYRIVLDVDRNELGFIHTGWEQYRKYYNDTGGYFPYPATQPPQILGTDLHLDLGKAWVDFGLTLPHWPRIVFGYEYNYKRGEEATTSWGSDGVGGDPRNIAPTSKHIDEGTHVIKFDLDAEVHGVTIEDRFRGEFYKLNNSYTNVAARGAVSQDVSAGDHYFQGANSIRLEKKFKNWLFGSGGYFYSKLNAEDSFTDITINNNTLFLASAPSILLARESHIFNLNGLLGPFDGLTVSAGAQSEWTRQQGIGSGNLNGIGYTRPPGVNFNINPATLSSDYEQNTISETAGLRYAKIPFTALFADARLQQETIGQSDSDIQPAAVSFLENPSFSSRLSDLRAGFNTSPWQRVSLSAHYRRYESDSQYKTNQVPQPVGGYPGLLSWRDLVTDEVEAKLVFRPFTWLKTTLSYQIVTTDFKQDTRPAFDVVPPITYSPGGFILAGKYESHIYSLGAIWTPRPRLFLSGTFSYQDTSTTTASSGIIPPYKGGVYSALVGGTYLLDKATDLLLNYSFSLADYSQANFQPSPTSPPPLGIRYQQHALQAAISRRLSKRLTTRLQYGYYYYDEPTAAAVNNYRVQSIFATLTYHLR
jgi:cytochrome c